MANVGLDLTKFKPFGERIHVRLYDVDDLTEGGIALPDMCQINNQEAEVLGVPDGLLIPDFDDLPDNRFWRTTIWPEVGDTVFFLKNALHPLTEDMREGVVRQGDLLAVLGESGQVFPMNDYVQLELEEWEEKKGSILTPELAQHRPHYGTIRAIGPGVMNPKTFLLDRTVFKLDSSLKEEYGYDAGKAERRLIGRRVHFIRSAEVHECGRTRVDFILIKADSLVVVEDRDGGNLSEGEGADAEG